MTAAITPLRGQARAAIAVEVAGLARLGYSDVRISAVLGISSDQARAIRVEYRIRSGQPTLAERRATREEIAARIADLVREGHQDRSIAKLVHRSIATVRDIRAVFGIPAAYRPCAAEGTCPECGGSHIPLTRTGRLGPHNRLGPRRNGIAYAVACAGEGHLPELEGTK